MQLRELNLDDIKYLQKRNTFTLQDNMIIVKSFGRDGVYRVYARTFNKTFRLSLNPTKEGKPRGYLISAQAQQLWANGFDTDLILIQASLTELKKTGDFYNDEDVKKKLEEIKERR